MKRRVLAVVLSVVFVMCLITGCAASKPAENSSSAAAPAADTQDTPKSYGKLLWLQTHNNNSFMTYMGEVFVEIAEQHGFEVDHLTADSDEGKQLAQIEQGVSSGQYVGIVCDCTGEGVTQGFKEAKEAGLFVMTLHEGVVDNTYVDCIVNCSIPAAGRIAVEKEVEELGTSWNVAIVNGSEGHGATVACRQGYDEALAKYPDIKIVFDGAGNWNAEDAMALTESWFSSGTKIDGILCMNDGMATGVRQVMRDNGVLGTIPIYSCDCEENTLQAIEAGEQSGSFDMNAEGQSIAAVEAMQKLIDGQPVEKEISVEPLLVTLENIAEYREAHVGDY